MLGQGGGESIGEGNDDSGGGDGGDGDMYKGRAEPMLVLLSVLYSEDDSNSICDNRPSSCSVYTITDYF